MNDRTSLPPKRDGTTTKKPKQQRTIQILVLGQRDGGPEIARAQGPFGVRG